MAEDASWSARYLASESSGSFKVTVLGFGVGGWGGKMEKNGGSPPKKEVSVRKLWRRIR